MATAKERMLEAEPEARLDFYESLRNVGFPCWHIRIGFSGPYLSYIAASPRDAWKSAAAVQLRSGAEAYRRRRQRIGTLGGLYSLLQAAEAA